MFAEFLMSPAAKWFLSRVFTAIGAPPIRIAFGSGELQMAPAGRKPIGTVAIRDLRTLLALAIDPAYGFGEGYARGTIEIEGDLYRMLVETYRAMESRAPRPVGSRLRAAWMTWRDANSLRGSRRNIHRHYDIGTDFYRLWLDEQLLYTCAYFPSPEASLEEAQVAKMDYVCRKVRLRPGDKVVEAGCGWGALALHMARRYGATVRACNISREQIQYARERARSAGLADRVEFIEDDYRNLSGKFDAFVSVGMLEHVGQGHYAELGAVIDRCLEDSGRGFLHFIGRNRRRPLDSWIRKRIFPGAYPPTLREVLGFFEERDFSVLDVENLRLHYARTLEHWLERYERAIDRVAQMFDAEFSRAWRLYLAGSAAAFRAGTLQLFQISFARGKCNAIPWTRRHLYADGHEPEPEGRWTPAMS